MTDCNSLSYKGKTYTRKELAQVLSKENTTKLSSKSIEKLELFLNKTGIQVLDMSNERAKELAERSGNKNAYINAVADTTKGIIEINAGKKDVALAEESAHILVSMLKQSNPKLYKEMYNKIGQYKIWDTVVNDPFYSKSKNYQIDGKRNIPLLKEEAIGKLVAEVYAKLEGENSKVDDFTYPSEEYEKISFAQKWFTKVLEWFKNLFKKPGFNPFEETANILRGEKEFTGNIKDLKGNQLNQLTNPNAVNATLKLVDALRKPKAEQYFKNIFLKGNKEVFYNKLMQDLGVPKQQIEILKNYLQNNEVKDIEELELGIMAEMSYTVEVNTAKSKDIRSGYEAQWGITDADKTDEDYQKGEERPTQYYSNLTASGHRNNPDWEYVEKEIAIPGIIPSIKGHAQFSTDNGIGWTRQSINKKTKTVAVEEIQSDLFQKGRDNERLTDTKSKIYYKERFKHGSRQFEVLYDPSTDKARLYEETYDEVHTAPDLNIVTVEEANRLGITNKVKELKPILRERYEKDTQLDNQDTENKFLQLLNKDGNWIPFFLKTIIQDSAKKGYEKVLFPTGDTVVKIESPGTGINTIEEAKQQNQDRLAKVGIFYETTVGNILRKIYGKDKVERIKDEYGNEWYELNIERNRDTSQFFFQAYQLPSSEGKIVAEQTIRDIASRMSERIGMSVKFESDRSKQYKGKIEGDTAIINLAYATMDTPIHEILGHPIIRAIRDKGLDNSKVEVKKTSGGYQVKWTKNDGFIENSPLYKTEQEANDYADTLKVKGDPTLYNNLLKELESGTGKEVLDRIKRDYTIKSTGRGFPEYSKYGYPIEQAVEKLVEAGYSLDKAVKWLEKNFEGVDGEYMYFNFPEFQPEFPGDEGPKPQTTITEVLERLGVGETQMYSLEEQQEEALVELLGLMTADKLDKVKDGKLISLLKRLLKEIASYVRSLIGAKEIEIEKLPDNMTLSDIADVLAYSNSKLILPGYEVLYTTPDNQKFKSYGEASKHISELTKSNKDIELPTTIKNELSPEQEKEVKRLKEEVKELTDRKNSKEYKEEKDKKIRDINTQIDEIQNKKPVFYTQEPSLKTNDKEKYGFKEFDYVRVESTYGRGDRGAYVNILGKDYVGYYIHGYNTDTRGGRPGKKVIPITKEQAEEIWNKDGYDRLESEDRQELYRLQSELERIQKDNQINWEIQKRHNEISNIETPTIQGFINKNEQYEQSKEIIDEWKKINNIKYNPEEVYSRGQGFYSVVGAYSNFDVNLMFQNILHHIEDNQKAGGEFVISAFTKPVDRNINHLEGGGGKIKFVIYPQSEDIKWAANKDVYSGSVWDASAKVSKDKKSELLGVSYTKAPALENLDAVKPNLAKIIDGLQWSHNELGIALTGKNFRLEYDENVPASTKKLINSINSILDQKYGKLEKPKQVIPNSFIVGGDRIYKEDGKWYINRLDNAYHNVENEDGEIVEILEGFLTNEEILYDKVVKIYNKGIQPTQTSASIKESIESIKKRVSNKVDTEYTSKALVNKRITALKEVAKKYPRSLIVTEVRRKMNPVYGGYESPLMFDDDLPFQKVPFQNLNDNLYNKIQSVNNKVVQKDNSFFVNDIAIKYPFFKETEKGYSEPMKDVAEKAINDINNILSRYIDENGLLRDQPLEYTNHQLGSSVNTYNALEKNISERLLEYPKGTKFLYNTILYNEAKQQATNIDFLAIRPNNTVDILTWEFLNEPKKDISKTNRENMQKYIGRVKYLLREAYDIKDFNTTRAIPIIINFNVKDHKFSFKGLQIGSSKVEDIKKEFLLPIPTKDEKTGDISIDKYIQKLNSLYKVINESLVIEGRRDIKYSELSAIYKAIRNLQLKRDFKPLFQQVQTQIDNTKILLDKHKDKFDNQPIDAFTDLEINEEASKLYKLAESLEIYKDLDLFFEDYFKQNLEKHEKDLEEVRRMTGEARSAVKNIKTTINTFTKRYVAEKRNITNLLDAEKSVNTLDRNFRTLSQAPTKAAQTYWSIAEEWRNKSELQTLDLIEKLIAIEKDVKDWVKNKNLKLADYKKLIEKTDNKNQGVNQLIDKYDKEFYIKLKDAISKKDIKWIKNNIDVESFKVWLANYKKNKLAQIDESVYLGTKEEQAQAKKKAKLDLEKQTNLENGRAFLNYIGVKQFPTNEWYSKEYNELLKPENKPLLDLYNYAIDINNKAKDSEYLEANKARTFLPFIRKTITEKYVFGGSFNPLETIIANMAISDDSVGYGNFNPLTGEIEDTIPKYFTSDISAQRTDKDGNVFQDYSNVSDDIFKNLAIYTKQVIEYEAKKNVEGLANILYFVEKNKQSLQINQFGNLIENAILFPNESNEINARFFKNYLKNNLYGQKYITTESSDILLGSVAEKLAKNYNKMADKLGLPKVSDEIATRNLSAVKVLDSVNRVFTLKTLGLNVASSIAQFMGGNFQAFVNTGKYYDKKEFYKAEWQFATHKLIKDEENVHLALMKTFLPVGEEQLTRMMNKMSLSNLTKEGLSDLIMFMMRNADYAIQYANFLAMMDNAVVIDGKLQNVREYYRNSDEYTNRYNLSEADRKKLEKDFDNKVDELKEKYGIAKKSNVIDGKLKIVGATEESIHKYRSLVQQIGKRAAGNITSNDENQIRMTVLGRSFMMFKNWIPNLVYQRVQPLTYIAGTDSFEYGRMRMAFKYYSWFILPNVKKIKNTILANEQGLKDMKELYEKKRKDFLEKNGRELEISESEFYDLIRQNLEAQVRDTILMLSLLGMFLAAKSMAPDDDEDKMVKNAYGYYLRTLDNVVNEMTFYYNPLSLQHVLGGNLFPALGVLTDVTKILNSMGKELFGYIIQDDELIEDTHPLKYIMKTFPVTKEMLNYISIFDPESAKEMGIIMSSTARR